MPDYGVNTGKKAGEQLRWCERFDAVHGATVATTRTNVYHKLHIEWTVEFLLWWPPLELTEGEGNHI